MGFRDDRRALRHRAEQLEDDLARAERRLAEREAELAEHEAKSEAERAELDKLRAEVKALARAGPAAKGGRVGLLLGLLVVAMVVATSLFAILSEGTTQTVEIAPTATNAVVPPAATSPAPPTVTHVAIGAMRVSDGTPCVAVAEAEGTSVERVELLCDGPARDLDGFDASHVEAYARGDGLFSHAVFAQRGPTATNAEVLVTSDHHRLHTPEADFILATRSFLQPGQIAGAPGGDEPATRIHRLDGEVTRVRDRDELSVGDACWVEARETTEPRCRLWVQCGTSRLYDGWLDCPRGVGPEMTLADEARDDGDATVTLEGQELRLEGHHWRVTLSVVPARCDLNGHWVGRWTDVEGRSESWRFRLTRAEDGSLRATLGEETLTGRASCAAGTLRFGARHGTLGPGSGSMGLVDDRGGHGWALRLRR